MELRERIRRFEPQMIADRRWLHEHPELSGHEIQTMQYVMDALKALKLDVCVVPDGGVIGVLQTEKEGPCVLMRADMDALPVQESENNLSRPRCCISAAPGVMHACGHDAHMAMLLCAARILVEMRDEIQGSVLFVFERGEEKGGKGFLKHLLPYIEENFSVDVCCATHVRWDIPAGKAAILPGAAMAGGFGFDVKITGRGGHGSRPDMACSPIDCFAAIHQQLSALRMRVVAPDQVLTYSLGVVQAGEQANVIPQSLRFAGTVRTFDTAGSGERFAEAAKTIIDQTCTAHGCGYELTHFSAPLYEVYNYPAAAQHARRAIQAALGADVLTDAAPWMASETMSAYLKLWPGVLMFTGIRNEESGCGANHHTAEFDVDESAMAAGIGAMLAYVLDVLREKPDYGFSRNIISIGDLVHRSI